MTSPDQTSSAATEDEKRPLLDLLPTALNEPGIALARPADG